MTKGSKGDKERENLNRKMGTPARLFCRVEKSAGQSARLTARPYLPETPVSEFCLISGVDPLARASGWYHVTA